MKRLIMICATLLTGLVLAHAESISLEDVLLKPGETVSVGIKLTNSRTDLVSFQMDVYLPEGISVNRSGCSLTSRFSSGEPTIGLQNDGSYRVTATSFTLSPIMGTEGDLINLSLTASANALGGEASIRNIRFVTSGSVSVLAEDVTFNILSNMDQSIALTELPVMTYGDDVYTLPAVTEQGMPIDWSVDNSAVAEVVGNNLMIIGAGTATVTAYQEGNNHYNELEQTFALTVNKAPLTITAQSYTIEQGQPLPTFEATYEGFVYNQTASALTTQPSFSCTAANSDVLGTYDITVSGAASQNYEISYVGGTLTIEEAWDYITITSDGVGTYCSNKDLDLSNVKDFTAYVALGYNTATTTVTVVKVTDVPAGTGLYLQGKPGTYQVPHGKSYSYYVNMLKGTTSDIVLEPTEGDYTNFILYKDNTSGIAGFRPLESATNMVKNKAYLQVPSYLLSANAKEISILVDDLEEDGTATGISDVNGNMSDDAFYTLSGVKVEHPQKGIYIRHGKKVIVK